MAPSLSSCQDDMTFFTSILQHQHQLNHSSPTPTKPLSTSILQHQQTALHAAQNISVHQMEEKVEQALSKEDVTIYVGSKRKAYVLSIHSLRGSAFFHSLISSNPPFSPIFLDCQESVFENVLTILRYGTFSALPPMPTSHTFQLKRELQLLGIPLPPDSSSPCPPPCSSSSSSSSSSISSVNQASPTPSRKSLSRNSSPLVKLPEFLENQERLVLVSRMDGDRRWQCPSCQEESNEWALNFHHRHAFCTACGQPAIPIIAPKLLAEMFTAAASYYSGEPANPRIWSIRSDSVCTLTFVSSSNSNPCPSSSSSRCSPHDQMWALSSFFLHAFCTHCGNCADSKTLLDLLFKCRYGSLRTQVKSISSSNSLDSKIQNNSSMIMRMQ